MTYLNIRVKILFEILTNDELFVYKDLHHIHNTHDGLIDKAIGLFSLTFDQCQVYILFFIDNK